MKRGVVDGGGGVEVFEDFLSDLDNVGAFDATGFRFGQKFGDDGVGEGSGVAESRGAVFNAFMDAEEEFVAGERLRTL